MIQSEEIKFIGSWLHHNDEWNSRGYKGYFKWDIECWFLYAECCIDLENVSPIYLTEEILLGCGFFYDIDSGTFKISDCTLQLDRYSFEDYDCIIFGDSAIQIKYLHQLQQLYHSLTGKELQIKL